MCHVEKSTPGQLGISSIELSVQRVESGGELSKTATTDIMNLQVRKTLIFLTLFQVRKTLIYLTLFQVCKTFIFLILLHARKTFVFGWQRYYLIKVAEGDVVRGLEIPLYLVFPK